VLQTPKVFVQFFKDFKLSKLSLLTSILSKLLQSSNLFSLFPPSTLNNHSLLRKKVVGISFFKIQIKSYVRKRKPQMIQIHPLKRRKRKEVKEDPNLVANGRFQCLVGLGGKRRSTFSPFHLFPLPPPPTKF
jgi:hypothetical protein